MKNTAILLITLPRPAPAWSPPSRIPLPATTQHPHADQHQDAELKLFLMRVEWDLADFQLDLGASARHFNHRERFKMDWRLANVGTPPKLAIFVSR